MFQNQESFLSCEATQASLQQFNYCNSIVNHFPITNIPWIKPIDSILFNHHDWLDRLVVKPQVVHEEKSNIELKIIVKDQ